MKQNESQYLSKQSGASNDQQVSHNCHNSGGHQGGVDYRGKEPVTSQRPSRARDFLCQEPDSTKEAELELLPAGEGSRWPSSN